MMSQRIQDSLLRDDSPKAGSKLKMRYRKLKKQPKNEDVDRPSDDDMDKCSIQYIDDGTSQSSPKNKKFQFFSTLKKS